MKDTFHGFAHYAPEFLYDWDAYDDFEPSQRLYEAAVYYLTHYEVNVACG